MDDNSPMIISNIHTGYASCITHITEQGSYNPSAMVSGNRGRVALFPGPTQLFIAISTEKRGDPGIFSHVSMTYSENGENFQDKQAAFRIFLN